jgi:hypothetical protein
VEGIEGILLKGPSLAEWLYRDGFPRNYVDTDLLVSPVGFARAREIARGMGFAYVPPPQPPSQGPPHADHLFRPSDGANLDMHRTLFGVGVPPPAVWQVLRGQTTEMEVGGCRVPVLDEAARALQVALHAAQHGSQSRKAVDDLRRALQNAGPTTWSHATWLAGRLDATQTFATGLRLLPEGAVVADAVGLVDARVAQLAREPRSRAPLAVGIDRVARQPGRRAKLRLLTREAFPSREYLRWSSPLARRGSLGLALAYAWRLMWLSRHAVPSTVAWWRAQGRRS